MDHAIGWVPDTPHPHVTVTVRTAQGVAPAALLIPLPIGQKSDDLHCPLDDALNLRQGLLNEALELGKRLGGLHPVVPDALEAFGKHMLYLCGAYNYVARLTQVAILLEPSRSFHHIV
jgi:hypothetical protein